MWLLGSETADAFSQLTSLGAAGIMGAMWLWERRQSQQRDQQLDESHTRILGDRVQLEQLIEVVNTNAQAMTRLATVQDQLVRTLDKKGG
jgi:hypothetical protein